MDASKINKSQLKTYKLIIALSQMNDKDKKSRVVEKTCLLLDISIDNIFEILFLILSNVKVNFNNQKLK